MTIVSANDIDPEWKFGNNVIDEVDCILLRMQLINLQGADAGSIINCRVLAVPALCDLPQF